jgi:hypothetical protein
MPGWRAESLYVIIVEPAHVSRTVFSVPSRRLNALVDLMLND